MEYKQRKNNPIKPVDVRTHGVHPRDARVNLRINKAQKEHLQRHCQQNNYTINDFIDALINREIGIAASKQDSGWRWHGDIEDLPLEISS